MVTDLKENSLSFHQSALNMQPRRQNKQRIHKKFEKQNEKKKFIVICVYVCSIHHF